MNFLWIIIFNHPVPSLLLSWVLKEMLTIKPQKESTPLPTYLVATKMRKSSKIIKIHRIKKLWLTELIDFSFCSTFCISVLSFPFTVCQKQIYREIPILLLVDFTDLIYSCHSLYDSFPLYWTLSITLEIRYYQNIQDILILKVDK